VQDFLRYRGRAIPSLLIYFSPIIYIDIQMGTLQYSILKILIRDCKPIWIILFWRAWQMKKMIAILKITAGKKTWLISGKGLVIENDIQKSVLHNAGEDQPITALDIG
jgi:hypothetical protein